VVPLLSLSQSVIVNSDVLEHSAWISNWAKITYTSVKRSFYFKIKRSAGFEIKTSEEKYKFFCRRKYSWRKSKAHSKWTNCYEVQHRHKSHFIAKYKQYLSYLAKVLYRIMLNIGTDTQPTQNSDLQSNLREG
jgi:uncharacterized protein YmfQ (DUF2313 family)